MLLSDAALEGKERKGKEWKDKETEQKKLLGENGADPQITNTSLQGEAPGSHSQLSRLTDFMKEKQLSSMGPNKKTRPLHTRGSVGVDAAPSISQYHLPGRE